MPVRETNIFKVLFIKVRVFFNKIKIFLGGKDKKK